MADTKTSSTTSRVGAIYSAAVPFIAGFTSGSIATTCVQPIDTVKVRLQLIEQGAGAPAGLWTTASRIVSQDGFLNLYQGLSAAYMRQLVYGTMRLGLFSTFEQALQARSGGGSIGFKERAGAGLAAGALASFVGTPTEVALIRMQADSTKPLEQRAHYRSAFDALSRITREEGVLSLWKGATPTIVRAMALNFGQLAFFSESKHRLAQYGDGKLPVWGQTAIAASIAGFAGSVFSLPFDFVKTRLQNQAKEKGTGKGATRYSGMVDCFTKTVRNEGPLRFYRDFAPYLVRIVPHTLISLFIIGYIQDFISIKA